VRRVKRLNPPTIKPNTTKDAPKATTKAKQSIPEQQELFSLYRYHAVFSDSPLTLVQSEKAHCGHAIIDARGATPGGGAGCSHRRFGLRNRPCA